MIEAAANLTALVRNRDLAELRHELMKWRPQELVASLCEMTPNDPVIAFRVLPRRAAASVFEYMPAECQLALVKAMGHEDMAAILNTMSPDDRTLLLSELPANATKTLLALLTPEERAEAVT